MGMGISSAKLSAKTIVSIGFPGELFLAGLEMAVVPFVALSMIVAVSKLKEQLNSAHGIIVTSLTLCILVSFTACIVAAIASDYLLLQGEVCYIY